MYIKYFKKNIGTLFNVFIQLKSRYNNDQIIKEII